MKYDVSWAVEWMNYINLYVHTRIYSHLKNINLGTQYLLFPVRKSRVAGIRNGDQLYTFVKRFLPQGPWWHKWIHFHRNRTLEMQMPGSEQHPPDVLSEHANTPLTRATETYLQLPQVARPQMFMRICTVILFCQLRKCIVFLKPGFQTKESKSESMLLTTAVYRQ
jgi:hypothetical protein